MPKPDTQPPIMYGAITLKTLNPDGSPPKSRLSDPSHARQIVSKCIEADLERNRVDTKIKGAIDGNPPYPRVRLKSRGELWRTNTNMMELRAYISQGLTPYYDLFAGAPYYMEIMSEYGEGTPDQVEISRLITEEVDQTLREWDGFDYNIWAMLFDFVAYGKGFVFFPDDKDFRFRHVSRFRIKVPDGTLANTEDLEVLVVREAMAAHRLWGYIKDEKASTAAGWDRQVCIEAIRRATPKIASTAQYDYDYYQQQLKDHDLYEGIRTPTIQLAYVYVREFDNSVSQFIVVEPGRSEPVSSDGTIKLYDSFLFQKTSLYENFEQLFKPFFFEVLDGSWHGATGLGHEIYAAMEVKNRMHCTKLDLAFIRGSILLQAKTANAMTNGQLMQLGHVSLIGPDYDIQQSSVLGDVDTMIKVNRDLDMMISSNTGIYRQTMDKPEGNPRTAEEVRLQYQNQAMLGNSAVNRFYSQLDGLYYEIYRRLAEVDLSGMPSKSRKMAQEFRDRCKRRGIPDEALKNCKYVRAYRNIGNGSGFMRQQSIMGLMNMFPMMPESGKEYFVQDAIAAFANQTFVNRYYPVADRNKLPTDQQAQAMLENAAIKVGAPVTWTPTNNNVIHLQTHLQSAAQAAASLEQGAPAPDVLAYMEGVGQHSAQHIQSLSQDPSRKNEFQPLLKQFQDLGAFADKLRGHVQEQAQKQQQDQQMQMRAQMINQGMDPKTQIDAAATRAKIGMQQEKTNAALQQKQEKHDQALALKDAQTAATIKLQREKQHATVNGD